MSKNPLKDFDYDTYYSLLDLALDEGVHIVHDFSTFWPYGGQTFVWARDTEFKNSRMIRVSISHCNPNDKFCKKIGTLNALNNWYNKGEAILLPIGNTDSAEIVHKLRNMFQY